MKKFKISLLAVFAVILAITASSFTVRPTHTNAEVWFTYDGGTMTDPASYTYAGTEPSCVGNTRLCAIKVLDDGSGSPDQSALNSLDNSSNHFSQPVSGVIDFKP